MQPKIAYLIDQNVGWDEDPIWQLHTQEPDNRWKAAHGNIAYKRIVYWEVPEDESV